MLHFNQINDKIGSFLSDLQTTYMSQAIQATKKALHDYLDELATTSISISNLADSSEKPISKEMTQLPTLETNLYQQVDTIMNQYHILPGMNSSQYQFKQFIKFLSDITLNGSNMGNLNALPKEVRQVCVNLIAKKNSTVKNLIHVDDDYCITIHRGAKYFLIRKELFNGLKNNCNDETFKIIFNFTADNDKLYTYDYENDFPNNIFNIKGLSLNQ